MKPSNETVRLDESQRVTLAGMLIESMAGKVSEESSALAISASIDQSAPGRDRKIYPLHSLLEDLHPEIREKVEKIATGNLAAKIRGEKPKSTHGQITRILSGHTIH